MFRDSRMCFRYLRRLSLHLSRSSEVPGLGKLMAAIFRWSTKLLSLHLGSCDVTEIDERVAPALFKLSKLRSFKLHSPSEQECDLLKTMQAPLTDIEVGFYDDDEPVDPVPMFANFKDSLEYLGVGNVTFESAEVQYARLIHLRAGYCPHPDLRAMGISFPNLRDLSFHTGDPDDFHED